MTPASQMYSRALLAGTPEGECAIIEGFMTNAVAQGQTKIQHTLTAGICYKKVVHILSTAGYSVSSCRNVLTISCKPIFKP